MAGTAQCFDLDMTGNNDRTLRISDDSRALVAAEGAEGMVLFDGCTDNDRRVTSVEYILTTQSNFFILPLGYS